MSGFDTKTGHDDLTVRTSLEHLEAGNEEGDCRDEEHEIDLALLMSAHLVYPSRRTTRSFALRARVSKCLKSNISAPNSTFESVGR